MKKPIRAKKAQFGPDALVGMVMLSIMGLGGVFFLNVFVNGISMQGLLSILDSEIDQRCFYILLPLMGDEYITMGVDRDTLSEAKGEIRIPATYKAVEVAIEFNADSQTIQTKGWYSCTMMDGGLEKADEFCRCKGYEGVYGDPACYIEKNVRTYTWEDDLPDNCIGVNVRDLRDRPKGNNNFGTSKIRCSEEDVPETVLVDTPYVSQQDYFGGENKYMKKSAVFEDTIGLFGASVKYTDDLPLRITEVEGYIATSDLSLDLRQEITSKMDPNRFCQIPVYTPVGRAGVAEILIVEEE